MIASAAALAKQEMRPFTREDAQRLPLTGMLYAHVAIEAVGDNQLKIVEEAFVKHAPHLVIRIGQDVIQPLTKELKDVKDTSVTWGALYTQWNILNVSILTGGPLGWQGRVAYLEFAFRLTPEQQKSAGEAILIDAYANRYPAAINFEIMFSPPSLSADTISSDSKVYFFYISSSMLKAASWGMTRSATIFCDDVEFGEVHNKKFVGFRLAPGIHTFKAVHWGTKNEPLELETLPGHQYFLQYDWVRGALKVVPPEEALPRIKDLKPEGKDSIRQMKSAILTHPVGP